jgi:single-strand DNA-binding protein
MQDIATTQISGNLTQDVDLRSLPSGAQVARLRVASTGRRRNGDEWVDKTSYFTVDVFGGQANACAQYLAKGSRVFVEGELDHQQWTDQNGNRREAVVIRARKVLFEGSRANGTPSAPTTAGPASGPPPTTRTAAQPQPAAPRNGAGATADDLPF